jgi:hypothetical protein
MFTKASPAASRGSFGVILSAVLAGGLSVSCQAGEPGPAAEVQAVDRQSQPPAPDAELERRRLAEIAAATEAGRLNGPRVRYEGVPRGPAIGAPAEGETNAPPIVNVPPERAALFVTALTAAERDDLVRRQAAYADRVRRDEAALVTLAPEARVRRLAEIKHAIVGSR